MSIISLSRFRSPEPVSAPRLCLRVCRFERTLIHGGTLEGGVLTCIDPTGHEHVLRLSMTWDVLAVLRSELTSHFSYECDDTIVRAVLRYWGVEEFKQRLSDGVALPREGLVLDSLGGPCSSQPRRLLQASGLLPCDAA
jgi:hypothetical protein